MLIVIDETGMKEANNKHNDYDDNDDNEKRTRDREMERKKKEKDEKIGMKNILFVTILFSLVYKSIGS